jgi:GT2 family glycosyltransferase
MNQRISSSNQGLVSVIIPSYNRRDKLKRAVKSVQDQQYDDIEIIIVETPTRNTNVTPVTNSLLDIDIGIRINHIITERTTGPSEARNIGIREADGEYIAFLDDDDEWLPSKIPKQLKKLSESPDNIRASFTGNKKIDTDGTVINSYIPCLPPDPVQYQLLWNIGTFSMLMVHASVPETVGKLDTNLSRCEDQDYCLRISREYEFCIVDEKLVRKHTGNYEQLGNKYEPAEQAYSYFINKHQQLASTKGCHSEMRAAFEYKLGCTALNNSDYSTAIRKLLASILFDPTHVDSYRNILAAAGGPRTHRLAKFIANR